MRLAGKKAFSDLLVQSVGLKLRQREDSEEQRKVALKNSQAPGYLGSVHHQENY